MKFKYLNGYVDQDSSFISIEIEGGDNMNSIGDQVWISKCGNKMEVSENADIDVLIEATNLFIGGSKLAFKGAMRRMGVIISN